VAVLRVVTRSAGDVDRHVALLPYVRFERNASGVFVECAEDLVDEATVLLARAGLRLERAVPLSRGADLLVAVVPHLRPLRSAHVVDVVAVRAVPLGEATLAAHGVRRLLRRRPRDASERTRLLLRGEARAFRWRRLAFATARIMRSARSDGARPVVFDGGALEREPDHLAFSDAGLLGEWLRA